MSLIERSLEHSAKFWAMEYAIGKLYFEVPSEQRIESPRV